MVGYAKYFGIRGGAGRKVITVRNLNNSGSGSLRQAIADAGGGAWIRFTPGLSGRIRLGSALGLRSNITIDGRGANITIQGPGGSGSTMNAYRGDQNFILMYLKLDGPVGGNNDLLQVMNGTGASTSASDNAERFWLYHMSFTNAEDELVSFIRTEGKYTVQSSYIGNNASGNTGYCALVSHGTKGNYGWEKVTHKGTWTRNFWDRCKDRVPYITIPSNIHIYNNYYFDWAATALHVTARFGATLPSQLLFENNVATANRHNQLVKPTLGSAIDGDARLDGNMFTGGGYGAERNRSRVFSPPYSYSKETATTAFRNAVMAEAGWQSVPFPE
jgi:pectate lyase